MADYRPTEPFLLIAVTHVQHFAVRSGKMLFYPWYPAMMLAVESNSVIDIRLKKIAAGGMDVMTETRLMVSEKVEAAFEAATMLLGGAGSAEIIDFYRRHVAANAQRLAPRNS